METWDSGGLLSVCRHGGIEIWISEGELQGCRRGRMSSRALEESYDIEVWRNGDLGDWRRNIGL